MPLHIRLHHPWTDRRGGWNSYSYFLNSIYRLHERTFLISYNITSERHLNQKDDHALVLQCGSDVNTYCLILLSDPSLEGMSSVFALLSRWSGIDPRQQPWQATVLVLRLDILQLPGIKTLLESGALLIDSDLVLGGFLYVSIFQDKSDIWRVIGRGCLLYFEMNLFLQWIFRAIGEFCRGHAIPA